MAQLPEEQVIAVLGLQRRLLEIIHQATETAFLNSEHSVEDLQ
jgi:hypothetical protein